MHELLLCEALITTAGCQLAAKPELVGRRLRALKVSVGALSGCEPELLCHLFPHASPGTVAEGAELEVELQPARIACRDCGTVREVPPNQLCCPSCGSLRIRLEAGDGVYLTGLSLD